MKSFETGEPMCGDPKNYYTQRLSARRFSSGTSNSKSEILNSKQIRIIQIQNTKPRHPKGGYLSG